MGMFRGKTATEFKPQVERAALRIKEAFPGGTLLLTPECTQANIREFLGKLGGLANWFAELSGRAKVLPGMADEGLRLTLFSRGISLCESVAETFLAATSWTPGAPITKEKQVLISRVRVLLKALNEPLGGEQNKSDLLGEYEKGSDMSPLVGLVPWSEFLEFSACAEVMLKEIIDSWTRNIRELDKLLSSYMPPWWGVRDTILDSPKTLWQLLEDVPLQRLKNGITLGDTWADSMKCLCQDGCGAVMLPQERIAFNTTLSNARETCTFIHALTQIVLSIPREPNLSNRKKMVTALKSELKIGQRDQVIHIGKCLMDRLQVLEGGSKVSIPSRVAESEGAPAPPEATGEVSPSPPAAGTPGTAA